MIGHPDQMFGCMTFAQSGEDLMFLSLFRLMAIEKPSYLDIGAHSPLNISNTALLYKRGSRGVNVEANSNLIEDFWVHRPEDVSVCAAVGSERGLLPFFMLDDYSGLNSLCREHLESFCQKNPQFSIRKIKEVPVFTLNQIVAEYCGGQFPDLLTIDTEGMDYKILEAADLSNGPKVICVESIRGTDGDMLIFQLMLKVGYIRYCRTGDNVIYVRDDYSEQVR